MTLFQASNIALILGALDEHVPDELRIAFSRVLMYAVRQMLIAPAPMFDNRFRPE